MSIQTECGLVVNISSELKNYYDLFESLKRLQHRGRESFGIGFVNPEKNTNYSINQFINVEKYGLTVEEEKLSDKIKTELSKVWFGHVRYSTSGLKTDKLYFTQPILFSLLNFDDLCLVFNGNIPLKEWQTIFNKYPMLRKFYYNDKDNINDSYLIIQLLQILKNEEVSKIMKKKSQSNNQNSINLVTIDNILPKILIKFVNLIERAFSMVLISHQTTFIVRDRFGVRPLSLGEKTNELIIASESCAFKEETKLICDFQPGSVSIINNDTRKINYFYSYQLDYKISGPKNTQYCLFEYLYFMRPKTTANHINVKEFRIDLGKLLIKEIKEFHPKNYEYLSKIKKEELENILVCGIPSSGIVQAESFADNFGINYRQFIKQKKDYPHRTFILENNTKRQDACHKKYFITEDDKLDIENKILILIDDSIVRGNTIKHLIDFVNKHNPKEIHFLVSSPPIINTCSYGVDFPSLEELVINRKTIEQFRNELNLKSLIYLKNNLVNKYNKNNFCLKCF
tara:strand:+ start:26 stop:1564 length:1539 start_codon:yes stop_codon:yes gene_type:complete